MISRLAQEIPSVNFIYRLLWTRTPYIEENTIVDRISGAAHSCLFLPLDYCIAYTLPCFAGDSAIPTFKSRNVALFKAFKDPYTQEEVKKNAVENFAKSFQARAKVCDRFKTHSVSRLMRLHIEKECEKHNLSNEVKNTLIKRLGAKPFFTPTTKAIILIAAGSLAYMNRGLFTAAPIPEGGATVPPDHGFTIYTPPVKEEPTGSNWVAIVGIISGLACLVGGGMIICRSKQTQEDQQKNDPSNNANQEEEGQSPIPSNPDSGIIRPVPKNPDGSPRPSPSRADVQVPRNPPPIDPVDGSSRTNSSANTLSSFDIVSAGPTPEAGAAAANAAANGRQSTDTGASGNSSQDDNG